jgi:molybdate transport system substrate-binding protein
MKKYIIYFMVLALSLISNSFVKAEDLHVVSSGGFAEAYKKLAPEFEKQTGLHLVAEWGPSMGTTQNAIPLRLARGEDIDVVIMVGSALDTLIKEGKIEPNSKVVLANSLIACAVKEGSKIYDISTRDRFKETLLTVQSIAYSDSASGEYFKTTLMYKLGIKEQVANKSKQIQATPVGEIVARGESELGCQQRSELKAIKGIEIIGLIPEEVQLNTPFSGAIVMQSSRKDKAKDLLDFLSSPRNKSIIEETGLTPVSPH